MNTPSIVWSIAGTDSGGGAGLSADQRAAEAFGIHLCPVPAAITAQNSTAVTRVDAVAPDLLRAQLDALAIDMPPRVIKTGLLGSVCNARVLAQVVDALRQLGPMDLVVDPVLRASTGAALADDALLAAYRSDVLPRATVLTPNRSEAAALLGLATGHGVSVPEMAARLAALGPATVCITGGDAGDGLANDWLHSPRACGWLSLPRVDTEHHHGTGCTFASGLAAALAIGFVSADAAVLAKMLTTHALREACPMGRGAGPVRASAGFGTDPSLLPRLSPDAVAPIAWPKRERAQAPGAYAIVDSAARVRACFAAGARTVQLRIKRPVDTEPDDATWITQLRTEITGAVAAAKTSSGTLYINDHWQLALELEARALHLGQEDLLALDTAGRATLQAATASGVALGISSHSLWELCQAASWQPDYVACGPIWPTTTKAMPWRPQGTDNLTWWAHMAPAPVVAIGGILTPEQLAIAATCGAEGACVVRGLGADPAQTLPGWLAAWSKATGQRAAPTMPALPHPSL